MAERTVINAASGDFVAPPDEFAPVERTNPFPPLEPSELPALFERPGFRELPYEKRREALSNALSAVYDFTSAQPDFEDVHSSQFGQLATRAYAKLDEEHTLGEKTGEFGKTLWEFGKGMVKDIGAAGVAAASLGMRAQAAIDPTGRSKDLTQGASQAFGYGFGVGSARYIDAFNHIQDKWVSDSHDELKESLAGVRGEIDAGKAPLNDPGAFTGWLRDQSAKTLVPQNKWTAFRLGDYGVNDPQVAFGLADANQLAAPQNAGLVAAYIKSRDPHIWEQLEKNLATTPLAAALGDEAKAVTQSESGKWMDSTFGKGASEHLLSTSDPLMVAGYLIPGARAAALGKAVAKAEGGIAARAAIAGKGIAAGLPEQAALGGAMTVGHDPEATAGEVAAGAGTMMAAGAVMHGAGVAVGEGVRGVRAARERFAPPPPGDNGPYAPTEPPIPPAEPATPPIQPQDRAGIEAAPTPEVRGIVEEVVGRAAKTRNPADPAPVNRTDVRPAETTQEPWRDIEGTDQVAPLSIMGDYVISHRPNEFTVSYRPPGKHIPVGSFPTLEAAKTAAAEFREPPISPPETGGATTVAPTTSLPLTTPEAAADLAVGTTNGPGEILPAVEAVKPVAELPPPAPREAPSTSNKEAVVNLEREQRGLGPVAKDAPIANVDLLQQGRAVIEAEPNAAENIAARLRTATPEQRSISREDAAVLGAERVKLQTERDAQAAIIADEARPEIEKGVARTRWEELETKINTLDQAAQDSRSVWGGWGNFWQQLIKQDFTFEALERKARVSKDRPLTAEESATIKTQAETHAAEGAKAEVARKEVEELAGARKRIGVLEELLEAAGQPKAGPKVTAATTHVQKSPLAAGVTAFLDDQAAKAMARIVERRSKLSVTVDPGLAALADEAIIGAAKLGKGAIKFADWSTQMLAEVGDYIKPQLAALWKMSKARLTEMVKEAPRDIDGERASTIAGMKQRLAEGDKPEDLHRYARELARQHIAQGITELEPLTEAVHTSLREVIPDITAMEARDAWSGFGRWTPLDKAPEKVVLRQRSAEAQAVSKIELYEKGRPAPKTGVERELPTEAKRALEKKAAKLAKEMGIEVVDPATQLKSSLDAIKARLRNEIADMDFAISNKARMVKDKSGIAYDAETQALKVARDAKKADYDTVFPKEVLTQAEQLRRAEGLAQRNLEQWQNKLVDAQAGKFPKADGPELGPKTERLQELDAQTKAAKAEVDELRALANPKRSPVEVAIQARKTRSLNRIAELARRRREKDFAKPVKAPALGPKTLAESQAEAKLLTALAAQKKVENLFNRERAKDAVARLSAGKKIGRAIRQTKDASVNIASSFDFSAPRQGFFAILSNSTRLLTNPARGAELMARPLVDMFKAWSSDRRAKVIEQRIAQRPNALSGADKIAGIEYSPLSETTFTKYEENAHSILDQWAELPLKTGNLGKTLATGGPKLVSRGIRMSNRAFITFLNVTRAGLFDELLRVNFKDRPPTTVELQAVGNMVNIATGRGKLNPVLAEAASYFIWAPKLLTSRVQLLAGQPFYGGTMRTRAIVAKEYARIIASGIMLFGVSRMFDEKDENNPTSSDLGKVVRGNVRIDPWAGLQQITVLTTRINRAETKSIKTGKVQKSEPAGSIGRFLRTKLRPDWGTLLNIANRKNIVGEKTTPVTVSRDLMTPLSYRDLYDIMEDRGFAEGSIIWGLGLFGAGVSHHEDEDERSTK